MLRLATALEGLDDDHSTAATGAWPREHRWFCGIAGTGSNGRLGRLRNGQQFACLGDVGGALAVGEQAIMPDAVEAFGQHMHQEPADKFGRIERHGRVPSGSFDPIVFVLEGDASFVGRNEPVIGDGDPVRIARQIAQSLLGPGERRLGVDDPIDLAQWRNIFYDTAANQGDAADGAMPLNDGVPNLLKYALGVDPRQIGPGSLPAGQIEFDATTGSNYLTMTVNRKAIAPGRSSCATGSCR